MIFKKIPGQTQYNYAFLIMRKFHLVFLLFSVIIVSCNKGSSEQSYLSKDVLKECSEFATAEMELKVCAYLIDENNWTKFFGRRNISYYMEGKIVAGFRNLEKDIKVEIDKKKKVKTVTITLPQPDILYSKFDHDKIEEVDKNVGWLRRNFTADEKANMWKDFELKAQKAGTKEVIEASKKNMENVLKIVYRRLEFKDENITIKFN